MRPTFSTQVVPATAQTPEYCDVKGYVTPQIQFEVQLPTQIGIVATFRLAAVDSGSLRAHLNLLLHSIKTLRWL